MKNILEELYYGNIQPDRFSIPHDPEYFELNQKISDILQLWKNRLSAENYLHLENLLELNSQLYSLEAMASFVYRFKLEVKMVIEVMAEENENYSFLKLNKGASSHFCYYYLCIKNFLLYESYSLKCCSCECNLLY